MPRPRHIPERTCVACGVKKPKRELVRIACSPQGGISVDATGKAPGRGAYVCGPGCWDSAIGRGRLARSLRRSLTKSDVATLRAGAPEAFAAIPANKVPDFDPSGQTMTEQVSE